jgi:hypothetical protein
MLEREHLKMNELTIEVRIHLIASRNVNHRHSSVYMEGCHGTSDTRRSEIR